MEEDLLNNIKTFQKSADTIYKLKDFTSSTTLYFKVLFAVCDYLLLKIHGRTPKDHRERFSMMEVSFIELYIFLDKSFPIYQKTYSYIIDKETCDYVKKNVENIIKKQKIPI